MHITIHSEKNDTGNQLINENYRSTASERYANQKIGIEQISLPAPQQGEIKVRTAVLVHGCHGGTADWMKITFGTRSSNKRELLGRAPKGIRVAVELQAELIIWGGVSTIKPRFDYVDLQQSLSSEIGDIASKFDHHFDVKSRTTEEEIEYAARYAFLYDIERLVLISSPTHIARCLQTALAHLWNRPKYEKLWKNLCAFQSDTCYEGTAPDDVVVLEPWHRPDRPKYPYNLIGKALIGLPPGEKKNLCIAEIQEIIERYGGKI